MKRATSRITGQGQVSVPAEVRRRLGVGPGTLLEWEVRDDHAVVRRAGRFTSEDIHRLLFRERPARRSLEELKRGIREHVRRRHARR